MTSMILFYDESFPFSGERPDAGTLAKLSETFTVVSAAELSERLPGASVYVHLHGSYFPKDAWSAILSHVQAGKGLLAAGGAPFKTPVYLDNGSWVAEQDQTAYHQQLHIHEANPVQSGGIARLQHLRDIPLFAGYESLFTIENTFSLVLHVTRADDKPGEGGSAGPIDAHIYPLLKGISGDGLSRDLAAPAVLLEHTKGDFAGGRWLFINQPLRGAFWSGRGAEALAEWAAFAAAGVTELWLKPNYGSYELGERPVLMLQGQQLLQTRTEQDGRSAWTFGLRILKANSSEAGEPRPFFEYHEAEFTEVWRSETTLEFGRELNVSRIVTPLDAEAGFYIVECEAVSASGERRLLRQGFWGMDQALLTSGEMITCDRDYFRKNGRPLPIVGMTYMTSDVARKYLFLPNAAVWDRDMAQMKRAGINSIRTGIWTAWRNVMYVDGHPYEEVLRAIDAFFLTAKRYDLEVTFNFFAFTPETWEGVNPYLDPRSVEAQKRFIASIVKRHASSTHVHWDLINEPSMFDPKRIFGGPRSAHDRFERAHYIAWLKERHASIRELQERWNMTPAELPGFDAVSLPERDDISFNTTPIFLRRGGPWLDYTLFTMDMHNKWAAQLVETIRSIQPKQLVTVGQDEGLAGKRPSPFFYAEAVDYTTVHSWWQMDDLVWDGVFAKTPDKPNLIQETGIMYVETPDGRAKRSEEELRNILERKYAYAFSTGGAGAVQWIWNINFYMNNINESNIGALRADGTEKPEASVSYDFGAFMEKSRDLFEGRKLEEVAVIYPYSNDFSNRPLASESTSRAIRTLSYAMNVHAFGLGEYQLESLSISKPKLIIVPSAHNFSGAALERLLAHVRAHGGTLLFTGPLGLDEYWRLNQPLAEELGFGGVSNLLREELLELDGRLLPVSFGGSRIADSCKGVQDAAVRGPAKLVEAALGAGRLLWCPLPLELNERLEPLQAVYGAALEKAGVAEELEWLHGGELPGIYGRKLQFAAGSVYIFVSEFDCDSAVEVRDPVTGARYAFTLPQERTVMFAADADGKLLAVYRPNEVQIEASL
ncbi:alpha-amylase family protein [Paenibacillus montanisoli]|uniref:Glycoside hydrolase n=1 Tax=Paenibacillus montanisoli TaxID=2081970 RepID=A0A328U3Z6_9BACL|nr:alpha-amylase family protein [Paenibacillus montanisoli]RAP76772.1 glycoside hydrolase [Paenibacillus montanisoli]